jgi:hypothetical protein
LIPTADPADFLCHLLAECGLYFLGAGVSTGEAPYGACFHREPLMDFVRHATLFAANPLEHTPLSRLLLDAGADLTASDIDGRELRAGTYDLPDNLLMLEPELYSDLRLSRRLSHMARSKPEFIAVIGYSFAWTGERHNDSIPLDCVIDHYRGFSGPVFVDAGQGEMAYPLRVHRN